MTLDLEKALDRARELARPRTKEEIESDKVRQLEEAFLVARVLDNDAGRQLQELLWRKFGAPVVFDPAQGFETGAALGFYRSGQSTLLNWLGSMIERARAGGPAKPEKNHGHKGHK